LCRRKGKWKNEPMARIDDIRMMVRVARMYYAQGLRQKDIMDRLGIHQSTVSRLLERARKEGIVRISVAAPAGVHSGIEEALESRYGLLEAVVVDSVSDENVIVRDLGSAAAYYMESTVNSAKVIGISSWSEALLAMVDAMHPGVRGQGSRVVQILGGVGNPATEIHATQLTRRLAQSVGGSALLLAAPGVVGSVEAKEVLMRDQFVQEAVSLFNSLDLALVGIGAVEPSTMLARSGNVFSPRELRILKDYGAVGDICLRFFDKSGQPVVTPLDDRVIGIELKQLRRVPRVVGVAGGERKFAAIRSALVGRWINVLITDRGTADRLLKEESSKSHRSSDAEGNDT
jgi:DNA-binding transcriptional regulator LsrR (DeoR family)